MSATPYLSLGMLLYPNAGAWDVPAPPTAPRRSLGWYVARARSGRRPRGYRPPRVTASV